MLTLHITRYYFATVNEDSNMTYENLTMFVNIQPTFEDDTVTKGYFWIPNNSTVYRFHDIVRVVNLSMIVKSKTPCLDRIKEDYNHYNIRVSISIAYLIRAIHHKIKHCVKINLRVLLFQKVFILVT